MDAVKLLDKLHELKLEVKKLEDDKAQEISNLQLEKSLKIPPEVSEIIAVYDKRIELMQESYVPLLNTINVEITNIVNEIEKKVLEVGKSLDGSFLKAVYYKARTSWDTKGLEGFAVAHPEIQAFRSYGKPSVQIRSLKDKNEN